MAESEVAHVLLCRSVPADELETTVPQLVRSGGTEQGLILASYPGKGCRMWRWQTPGLENAKKVQMFVACLSWRVGTKRTKGAEERTWI